MKRTFPRVGLLALGLSALILGGCGKSEAPQASAYKSTVADKAEEERSSKDAPGGQKDEHGEAESLKLKPEEIQAAGIKIEDLAEQVVSEQLTLTATIRPNQDRITHVAPRVPGRVVKVNANLGDQVKAGQTLAVLDSLEVGEAHSAYLQAATQHTVAKADFERAEKLHADQIIAAKDHLRAHGEFEKAKAALAAAADRLRMLGVTPAPAAEGKAVSTFPLTTPFAGTVIEKHAILGELAQPDKQLFIVADLSTLWIEANLFEKDIGRVMPGAAAAVTVAAYPEEIFPGRLTYIAASVDKETRTVQARVEVANPDGRLKPEMFATAAITTNGTGGKGGQVKALLLPEEAVVLMQGQPTVFIEEHGAFEPRAVELGDKLRGRVVVKNGLAAGDKVVTAGTYALKARVMKSQLGEGH
ncbi:efflux RND transporter periplasmic adaptor subunit [Dechloromonas sp. A34]|uniref:efflux RND transporter periplasmic adaptor subunit n=1 Tax=Dechloromonas sp. A34 TaxID=447588 RepID=UPI0022490111|nr:efflux RND transporter periplasmic adaptor subunit [Dechloromonas sp. A34]